MISLAKGSQDSCLFTLRSTILSLESIVFFVWINSEDSLHRSGEPDDCYAVFRKKFSQGEIEGYQPQQEPERRYRLHGTWTDSVIYAHYIKNSERADSHLHLNRVTSMEYRIEAITVSTENIGLASDLLNFICREASIMEWFVRTIRSFSVTIAI